LYAFKFRIASVEPKLKKADLTDHFAVGQFQALAMKPPGRQLALAMALTRKPVMLELPTRSVTP
jgi:hypothetical protein